MPSPLLPGTSIRNFGPIPTKKQALRKSSRLQGAVIEVRGLGAVIEHWFAVSQLTLELTPQVLDFYADVIVHNGRQFVRKKTWATHDSITKDPGVEQISHGNFYVDMGPTTFYSRFLEWGTIHAPAYPFMLPAIDLAEPDFIKAMADVAAIADYMGGPISVGTASSDPRVKSPIQRLRGSLYSISKALGDVAVFGGRAQVVGVRSFAIDMARMLGDVQSIMSGTLSSRISTRLRGRATGRLRGYETATLNFAQTYSGFPGGEGGHRIYNRFMGRISTPVISTRLFGIG